MLQSIVNFGQSKVNLYSNKRNMDIVNKSFSHLCGTVSVSSCSIGGRPLLACAPLSQSPTRQVALRYY